MDVDFLFHATRRVRALGSPGRSHKRHRSVGVTALPIDQGETLTLNDAAGRQH